MKTFARLIRRYVLATAGIILVVVALLLGMTIYAGVRYNDASDSVQKVGALAEALHPTADGLQWDAAHTPAEWMQGYVWAMVLDEDGNVIWQQDLPEALNVQRDHRREEVLTKLLARCAGHLVLANSPW